MTIFWFRRDLRLQDNAGLYEALKRGNNVQCIFIFDTEILQHLKENDQRVSIIHSFVSELKNELEKQGSNLKTYFGKPLDIFKAITRENLITAVYTNHDYEPYSKARDLEIRKLLESNHIEFNTFKDQCVFEKKEVTKDDGTPYTVFTPYMKKWKQKLLKYHYKSYPTEKYYTNLIKAEPSDVILLSEMKFKTHSIHIPDKDSYESQIENYHETRNYPAFKNGTTRLSVHLRFGTISIRKLVSIALIINETWLNELIWRDFYMMILHHFPHVCNSSFKPKYDHIQWRNDEKEFELWCQGKTGYPIVDAGMRELNATGFMHNRVRMIVASFLTKHLLIDWRWGENYFAEKLIDFDLSANNGGWQWASGSGCDAAPYFRIFNPTEQTKKFDQKHEYIKKWVPEYSQLSYVPMVEHTYARNRCLATYKSALG
jgi:deoxyribodipyrimidine photo-lyase